MAGSWQHMTTKNGRLLSNERFVQMIENLGDAYEAAEECYGMVQWLAARVMRSTDPAEHRRLVIKEAQRFHKEGLRIGGVTR
jgi:hypothetical protein